MHNANPLLTKQQDPKFSLAMPGFYFLSLLWPLQLGKELSFMDGGSTYERKITYI